MEECVAESAEEAHLDSVSTTSGSVWYAFIEINSNHESAGDKDKGVEHE